MNRKITSHERMEIEGRYYIHEKGNHALKADALLAGRKSHITTDLYLSQEKTYGSGSIWLYCPESDESILLSVNVMHGKVSIQINGTMQSVKIQDNRRAKGGEEE